MATQLPLYHGNSSRSSRTFAFRDRHLLLVIMFVFAIICLGSLYYAPEVMEQVNFDTAYRKFVSSDKSKDGGIDEQQSVVDDQVAPSKAPESDRTVDNKLEEKTLEVETVKVLRSSENDAKQLDSVEDVKREIVKSDETKANGNVKRDNTGPVGNTGGRESDSAVRDKSSDQGRDDETRKNKVKEMMMHAWSNYVKYAWGQNELKPISKTGHSAGIFGHSAVGATIIDGADTLYIMGEMEEYKRAKDWIANSFNFNSASTDVSVFEVNIRFVGGLLSLYALTKEEVFKQKAVEVADKLLPAFNTPTGIPNAIINLRTGSSHNWGWASGGCSILAEFGTLHLEFQYLTHITGNPVYMQKVKRIRQVMKELDKPEGLYGNYVNPRSGAWGMRHVSLGALGDSFYEYLLKSWIGTSKKDTDAKEMYFATTEAMQRTMIKKTGSGLVYVGNYRGGRVEPKMEHLACFSGGMFALASLHIKNKAEQENSLKLGADLTNTCHESYIRSTTHIGPESFAFSSQDAVALRGGDKVYLMRPETVESYFVLWRVTHDPKYREWAWDAVQAIDKHCRVDNGFSGLRDVYSSSPAKDDVQQSYFLAETLKYLYLIFCDDSVISLDKWVFNTEAHPLPVLPGVPSDKD